MPIELREIVTASTQTLKRMAPAGYPGRTRGSGFRQYKLELSHPDEPILGSTVRC